MTTKQFVLTFLFFVAAFLASARNYYVATTGNDSHAGSITKPYATLSKAQSVVTAGDTVYIRSGVYHLTESQIMEYIPSTTRITNHKANLACIFKFDKSGTAAKRICYFGYPGERPVFDMSDVKPANYWMVSFFVNASYLHFRNFEVIGTQVTVTTPTNSWCFANINGSYNIYENLAAHDGMATGFWIEQGQNNLALNCDSYNNWDSVSGDKKGGNSDGFGGHMYHSQTDTGTVFRGCRAWYNSDDGFDLINSKAGFTFENCWSFYNGYSTTGASLGNGAGFKSGGYGMKATATPPAVIPRNVVRFCLAVENKAQGFYANHHLGGIDFYNNTSYRNPSNYNMICRKDANTAVDVAGYGHNIKNNVSYSPRTADSHISNINYAESKVQNNSWDFSTFTLSNSDFRSIDVSQLTLPRQADGSLPDIDFLKPSATSQLIDKGVDTGFPFKGSAPDLGYSEYK
ncbi:right-handed parallel beta-helix repeat-containing protein [Viscerimonas tarda]